MRAVFHLPPPTPPSFAALPSPPSTEHGRLGSLRGWKLLRVLVVTADLFLIACLGWAERAVAQTSPSDTPPGVFVDIGGHKLHLHCVGPAGAKVTIVFESGGGGSSKDWSRVRDFLPAEVRSCAYDRAGYGWSEPGPAPRTMRQEVFELHALLETAGISGPLVLVGQSIGGLLVREYAEHYGSNVVGVVLVDPTDESGMLANARYGGWVRLREKAIANRIAPEPRRSGKASLEYKTEDDYTAEEFQQMYLARKSQPEPFGDRPLIVLGAGRRPQPPDTSDEKWRDIRQERDEQVREQAHLSRNAQFILVQTSGHAIHDEAPEVVAKAIMEVLASVSKGVPLATQVGDNAGRNDHAERASSSN
jgi:pimeloyl-ACP methyl ester carboxylesterase